MRKLIHLPYPPTGTLFNVWLSRTITMHDHVLCAIWAQFWLHFWCEHVLFMAKKYPDLYSKEWSFISPASFHIFNPLFDTLILLVIAHSHFYPDQPFCPWIYGTKFVKHFFGLAWMILPNFTWTELIKMVQHVMVHQRILLSGDFKSMKHKKESNVGYIIDYDTTPLTEVNYCILTVTLTDKDIDNLIELAFKEVSLICTKLMKISVLAPTAKKPMQLTITGNHKVNPKVISVDEDEELEDKDKLDTADSGNSEAPTPLNDAAKSTSKDTACLSALDDDYKQTVKEAKMAPSIQPLSPMPVSESSDNSKEVTTNNSMSSSVIVHKSKFINGAGKLSLDLMLTYQCQLQSGTTAKYEHTICVNPKFALQ